MPEKTSTASESSLGMMEGLRSYIPNKGWEELSPEKKENSPNGPREDDFFADEYEPIPSTQIQGIEKKPASDDFLLPVSFSPEGLSVSGSASVLSFLTSS